MWGYNMDNRRRERRNNMYGGDILRLSAGGGKKWRNKLFLIRTGVILLVACAGLASAAILTWHGAQSIGQYLFYQNDIFALKSFKIQSNGDVVTPKLVAEYLGLNDCSNIFAFNMAAERATLMEKVPRIKGASFSRLLPGELTITINERQPSARLDMHSYFLTIDREGCVLGKSSGLKGLPVISGHDFTNLRPGVRLDDRKITRALDVIAACDSFAFGNYVKIKTIDVRKGETIDLALVDGEQVTLAWADMERQSASSTENMEKKLSQLADNIRSAAARGKKIISIDMTLNNNFPAQEN